MVGKQNPSLTIGILALQGAVREHQLRLQSLGANVIQVKKAAQLEMIDGLILPGGESTAISKLMVTFDLLKPLKRKIAQGFPVMGTCAGLILLAKQVIGQTGVYLDVLDVRVERNAFGRQKESFEQELTVVGMTEPFSAVFIRAPLIRSVGSDVKVLATVQEQIVAVQQDHLLGLSFHPELTPDLRFHQLFLELVHTSRSSHR